MREPLQGLFSSSKLLVLDFTEITSSVKPHEDIRLFFKETEAKGGNPRSPEARQRFNDQLLDASGAKYLVSRYGEDRSSTLKGSAIAREARTVHLGVDIFCKDLEAVYSPCPGRIVRSGSEPEDHSFGHYLILRPDDPALPYMFFGHLSASDMAAPGIVKAGQAIARIGDYVNGENGGWSRHLHLQMLKELPPEGDAPLGYMTARDFAANKTDYPDPFAYFSEWHIHGLERAAS